MLIWLSLLMPSLAQKSQQDASPETAWEVITPKKEKKGYYYGILEVPPDFVSRLLTDDNEQGSPFDEVEVQDRKSLGDLAPFFPMAKLPLCLPSHPSYYDLTEAFRLNGIVKSDEEWIVFSGGLAGDGDLHYCLSAENTEILLSFFMTLGPGRLHNIVYHSSIVSVPDQGLINKAWTMDRLAELKPKIHARHGCLTRSGDRSLVQFYHPDTNLESTSEIEPTLGEFAKLADLHFSMNHRWNSTNCPKLNNLITYTLQIGTPLVSDLGINGEDQRNYLQIQNLEALPLSYKSISLFRKHIQNIEGIYSIRKPGEAPKQPIQLPSDSTNAYRCNFDLIDLLKSTIETIPQDGSDPFSNKIFKQAPTLIRIQEFTQNRYMKAGDQVYDVTPQLKIIGLHNREQQNARGFKWLAHKWSLG